MSETLAAESQVTTYRGSSIEELLPRIRQDLGPEAVILRQREGLVGGVSGFFQKRCIEVEARPGGPSIDVYDEEAPAGRPSLADLDDDAAEKPRARRTLADVLAEDEAAGERAAAPADEAGMIRNDAATREGLEAPTVRKVIEQAEPFAELLDRMAGPEAKVEAVRKPEPEPALELRPGPEPELERPAPVSRTVQAAALRDGLLAAGLGEDIASEVIDSVVASVLPFATPARLRTLVRDQLALRIPIAAAPAPGPRALALVGPAGAGKTAAVARICAAHAAAGASVTCLTITPSGSAAALREMLGDSDVQIVAVDDPARVAGSAILRPGDGEAALCVVDTPPAWADAPGLPALAKALKALKLDEVHAVMRAGTAAAAGNELLAGLAPLAPNRLLATGLGETAHLGAIADVAIRRALPLSYLAEGPDAIVPADAQALASRMTP